MKIISKLLIILLFLVSCSKKQETVVNTPVSVETQTELAKNDSSLKNESGTIILAVSFGNVIKADRMIYKRITLTNNSNSIKYIPNQLESLNTDNKIFEVDPSSFDSTCLYKKFLKPYEKCSIKINLYLNNLGSYTKIIYFGKMNIPLFVNITEQPNIICGDGYHLNNQTNQCDPDIKQCSYQNMPIGANEAYQEWDYVSNQYMPSNESCYIKECNYLMYDTSISSNGIKTCNLKYFNINVFNSNSSFGIIKSTYNNSQDINCGLNCDFNFPIRSSVKIEAIPNDGYSFDHWEGTSCAGFTIKDCMVNYLDKSHLIIGFFKENQPSINNIKIIEHIKEYDLLNQEIDSVKEINLNANDIFYSKNNKFELNITGVDIKQYSLSEGFNCVINNYKSFLGDNIIIDLENQSNKKTDFSIKFKNFNKETSCFNFSIKQDTIAPEISILNPAEFEMFGPNKSITINGLCEKGLILKISGLFGLRENNCSNGSFNENFLINNLLTGDTDFYFEQIDLAGNKTIISRKYKYDNEPPSIPDNLDLLDYTLDKYMSPLFSFNPSVDVSNDVSYEAAIGTSIDSDDMVAWQAIGKVNSSKLLSLQQFLINTEYFLSVRAVDQNGNYSQSISKKFVYRDSWFYQSFFLQFIKPNIIINNSKFGTGMAYNNFYKTLFVSGKNLDRDVVYVFERDPYTYQYQQSQIITNDFTDADNFGYSIDTKGDYLYIGAPLEDSPDRSGASVNLNTLSNSGAVFVYQKINGSWIYKYTLKSSYAGANNNFGIKVKTNEDGSGVFVLSKNDNNRGNGSNLLTQGFIEYYGLLNNNWIKTSEFKLSNSNQIGDGESIVNMELKLPYIAITQENSTTKNNTVYLIKKIDDSNYSIISAIRANQNISGNNCLINSNYNKNFGLYLAFDSNQSLYTTSFNYNSTNIYINKCDYKITTSGALSNFQMHSINSNQVNPSLAFNIIDNNFLVYDQQDGVSYNNTTKIIKNNDGILDFNNTGKYVLLNNDDVTKPYLIEFNSLYNYSIGNSNIIIGDEDNLFVSNPLHSSCLSNPAATTCTNSGAVFLFRRTYTPKNNDDAIQCKKNNGFVWNYVTRNCVSALAPQECTTKGGNWDTIVGGGSCLFSNNITNNTCQLKGFNTTVKYFVPGNNAYISCAFDGICQNMPKNYNLTDSCSFPTTADSPTFTQSCTVRCSSAISSLDIFGGGFSCHTYDSSKTVSSNATKVWCQ